MSQVLQELQAEGQQIDPDAIAALSPYTTERIDRFGRYSLGMDQPPPPLDESIFSTAWLPGTDREAVAGEGSHLTERGAGPVQLPFDGW